MDAKFTFYDFIGFIIPGAVALVLLYWFSTGFLAIVPSIGAVIPESILLIIFLAASYFLGHVIQAIGAGIQRRRERRRGGWLSDTYFQQNDTHYTQEYKNNLDKLLQQTFALRLNVSREEQQQRQELFNLCRALLRQEGMGANTDILNATTRG